MKNCKTNKEVISDLIKIISDDIFSNLSGNSMMLNPALKLVKMKLSNLSDEDCDMIVDGVHKISYYIENETMVFSKYHHLEQNNFTRL